MAKKRFTDDLSDLFEQPFEAERSAPATDDDADGETVEVSVPAPTKKAKRKLGSKNFTKNLDAFLSDDSRGAVPRTTRRRRTGLDYLIRSTVKDDEDSKPTGATKPDTKRVTLIFNKEHLAVLKEQAKERNMYLKDVVQEMVAQYLEG